MWQSRWFAQLLHKWSENSGNKSSRNIREKEESWDSTWKVVICWQKKAAVIWRLLFQYALPCGSDSTTTCIWKIIVISIRTPLREWFRKTNKYCILIAISIRTPLREWFRRRKVCVGASFQYALPCGSDSRMQVWEKLLNFNTHSLAGVIQRHLPNLGSKDSVNFVRLLNALYSL